MEDSCLGLPAGRAGSHERSPDVEGPVWSSLPTPSRSARSARSPGLYAVARSWIYALLERYSTHGEAASEPRPPRPRTSPSATRPETVDLIARLRKELAGQGLEPS